MGRLMRCATTTMVLLAMLQCGCGAAITFVETRERDGSRRRVLSAQELPEFRRLWAEREEVAAPDRFRPSIRLVVGRSSWDYDPRGYVQLITIKRASFQRIRDVDAFNALVMASERL